MSKLNYKEFRCGNLLEFEGKIYPLHIVCEEYPFLDTPEFGVGVVNWRNLKPIPLTEELLLKCGLINPDGEYKLEKKVNLSIITENNNITLGWLNPSLFPKNFQTFQYLHQIQNFHFLFYGKELQINLNHE